MRRFHRDLADGRPTADALRTAALAVKADPRYAHPFYWAGFVVVGPGWTEGGEPVGGAMETDLPEVVARCSRARLPCWRAAPGPAGPVARQARRPRRVLRARGRRPPDPRGEDELGTALRVVLEHGTSRPFEPFDRQGYRDADRVAVAVLLDEFETLRRASLHALATARAHHRGPGARGPPSRLRRRTLGQLLATWAVHDLNHIGRDRSRDERGVRGGGRSLEAVPRHPEPLSPRQPRPRQGSAQSSTDTTNRKPSWCWS